MESVDYRDKTGDVEALKELAYLCGLILGDGTVCGSDYGILIRSTKLELIDIFCENTRKLGFRPYVLKYEEKAHKCPSGKIVDRTVYYARIRSKAMYAILRPCKLRDYKFKIPSFVFRNRKAAASFLQGYFDAEGSASFNKAKGFVEITAGSKHLSNIEEIKYCLGLLKIRAVVSRKKRCYVLSIADWPSRLKFKCLINFRIRRKCETLKRDREPKRRYYSEEVYQKTFELRKVGMSYGKISKLLGVPTSNLHRWVTRKVTPWGVKNIRDRDEKTSINNRR